MVRANRNGFARTVSVIMPVPVYFGEKMEQQYADYADDGLNEVAALSLPPHSVEAEQSVLGGLLLENSAWDRIADVVAGEDFYRHEHRVIFRTIAALIKIGRAHV